MKDVAIPFIAANGYAQTSAWVHALQQAMPDKRIISFNEMDNESKANCSVAIVANPNPADLQDLPRLQWVHSVWAGVERLVADIGNKHVKIVRLVDPQLAVTMAEAVLAWTMYLHRDMPAYARQQALRQWKSLDYVRPGNKTVGLLGLGALGEAAATRLLDAGFNVCGWSRATKNIPGVEHFSGETSLKAMLEKADILICLLPLTPETNGLLNAENLACLPDGASLINFSRGPIINDSDLRSALDSGRLKHAVLDVFEIEPLPINQWHWTHPGITVLPHCSAPTDRETASAIVARNIQRYTDEGVIPVCVDMSRGY
ncbi:2-hydroxyacid dehydrogenase [Collimonas sp. NPDC087041]|uniref:2-hydroxyacid dehydrogenase n=1 Tax=Collimonas sp. NPDC087041 TaxID=3363960 RepID=UPI00380FDC69